MSCLSSLVSSVGRACFPKLGAFPRLYAFPWDVRVSLDGARLLGVDVHCVDVERLPVHCVDMKCGDGCVSCIDHSPAVSWARSQMIFVTCCGAGGAYSTQHLYTA